MNTHYRHIIGEWAWARPVHGMNGVSQAVHGVGGRPGSRAFTLTELLVVISIFLLVLTIAVPGFNALMYTSEQAQAENALRVGLRAARDAAQRSTSGADAAAVFTHDPGGRLTITACVKVGEIPDRNRVGDIVMREVFVPAFGIAPIQLPGGWFIAGYTLANTIDSPGGGGPIAVPDPHGWYDSDTYPAGQPNWILPESGYFKRSDTSFGVQQLGEDGENRQTFMIRFEGGSGFVDVSRTSPVLVLMPSPATTFRTQQPFSTFRADQALRMEQFVARVIAAGSLRGLGGSDSRRQILGDIASDTVLVKPVRQVSVFNMRRLANGITARGINRITGTIYADPDAVGEPRFDTVLFPGNPSNATIASRINTWMRAETEQADPLVYAIDRHSGALQPLLPLEDAP